MLFELTKSMNENLDRLVSTRSTSGDTSELPSQPTYPEEEVTSAHTMGSSTRYSEPSLLEETDLGWTGLARTESAEEAAKTATGAVSCGPQGQQRTDPAVFAT